jgi:hypothetical protein
MAYHPEPSITFAEAAAIFENNPGAISVLNPKSQSFVSSLWDQYKKKGTLSDKQKFWIRVYAEKVPGASPHATMNQLNPSVDVKAALKKLQEAPKVVPSIFVGDALLLMLKNAVEVSKQKGGKKTPKIKFKHCKDKDPESPNFGKLISPKISFHIATKASKHMGCVIVTDGGPWGDSLFYGRIEPGGNFWPNNVASEEVIKFVTNFAGHPEMMGSAYGLSTFNCCFCGLDISTKESKSVGYGPVCAEKYGLTWGNKPGTDFVNQNIETGSVTLQHVEKLTLEANAKAAAMILVQQGQTIAAIKKVRMIMGIGLKDAKDLVDKWKDESISFNPNDLDNVVDNIENYAKGGVDSILETAGMVSEAAALAKESGKPIVTATQTISEMTGDDDEHELTAAELGFTCERCLDTGFTIGSSSKLLPCNHEGAQACAS